MSKGEAHAAEGSLTPARGRGSVSLVAKKNWSHSLRLVG